MRSGDEAHQCNATRAGLLRIPWGQCNLFPNFQLPKHRWEKVLAQRLVDRLLRPCASVRQYLGGLNGGNFLRRVANALSVAPDPAQERVRRPLWEKPSWARRRTGFAFLLHGTSKGGWCTRSKPVFASLPLCSSHRNLSSQDYKPGFWYWEVLECLRKLLLTGVAIQVAPGSLLQLVVSIFIIGVYVGSVAFFQPYKHKRDNTLALAIYAVIAITLFCGLLLKVKDGYERCAGSETSAFS